MLIAIENLKETILKKNKVVKKSTINPNSKII
jgi:hypothetical protein